MIRAELACLLYRKRLGETVRARNGPNRIVIRYWLFIPRIKN